MPGSGPKSQFEPAPEPEERFPAPRLSVELTPRWSEFTSNLAGLFRQPAAPNKIRPGYFWSDVFVRTGLPWDTLRKSYLSHALAVTLIWALTQWGFFSTHEPPVRNAFDHTTITYYNVSEYLPPLNPQPKAEPAKVSKRADPEYAKQEIISIRPNADNTHQTIISPNAVKLSHDVALPNIVAWTERPAPPTAAISHTTTKTNLDLFTPKPVAPAPQITRAGVPNLPQLAQPSPVNAAPEIRGHVLNVPNDILARNVVAPTPVISGVTTHQFEVPSTAVPPPPEPNALRRAGQINVGNLQPVATPALAAPEQQAITAAANQGGGRAGASALAQMASGGQPVPPTPVGIAGSGNSQAVGQLVALGLHPAAVTGPIEVPNGSRNGTFAAGPTGHAGAAGTPEIHGDVKSSGPGGTGTATPNPLDGIHVGPGAGQPTNGVVVAGPAATPPSVPAKGGGVKEVLMASLKKPSDLPGLKAPDTLPNAPGRGGDEVFGAKKYYTMRLNMPNLTSASGTWIMRFAELSQTKAAGELTAPVALSAVHPAYPTDLMRERVEGTVVLYAVIHTDGSVGAVRVLHGVDERLDSNARVALEKWRFRPGTKNGSAVDIEAVVQIPFVAGRRVGF
jgi:TonB family protein